MRVGALVLVAFWLVFRLVLAGMHHGSLLSSYQFGTIDSFLVVALGFLIASFRIKESNKSRKKAGK